MFDEHRTNSKLHSIATNRLEFPRAAAHSNLSGHRSSIRRPASSPRAVFQSLRRREPLSTQPNQLWMIEQGFVKSVSWDEEGNLVILGLWGEGDSVAPSWSAVNPHQLIAMTPVRVKQVGLNQSYPYDFLLTQAQRTQELFSLFRIRCLTTRLCHILWWLAERFGHPVQAGQMTGIPMTHQELAELTGSTRVTITRLLGQLEAAGQLERAHRQLLLKGSLQTFIASATLKSKT